MALIGFLIPQVALGTGVVGVLLGDAFFLKRTVHQMAGFLAYPHETLPSEHTLVEHDVVAEVTLAEHYAHVERLVLVFYPRLGQVEKRQHLTFRELALLKQNATGAGVTDVEHQIHWDIMLWSLVVKGHVGNGACQADEVAEIDIEGLETSGGILRDVDAQQ